MSVTKTKFDTMPDGREVFLYTIDNSDGVSAGIITRGATLQSFCCPDKDGKIGDIIAGFDTIAGHIGSGTYTGQVIGQYANRIGGACFALDGKTIEVTKNENGKTCLHGGGEYGFALWDANAVADNAVEFTYFSPDGENGFPGNVNVKVTYTLTGKCLWIHYEAVSDKKTVINLTNHAYFNLSTVEGGDVLDHEVKLNCSFFTPTDENSIPTGEILSVKGTPFDFTQFKKIGAQINDDDIQLRQCGGYDHNFVVDGGKGEIGGLRRVATVRDPKSGRELGAFSDMPGVQFYTGNFMNGEKGKNGIPLKKHYGFCLETQYFPNTPNVPYFPQCTFDANEKFESTTVFAVDNKPLEIDAIK